VVLLEEEMVAIWSYEVPHRGKVDKKKKLEEVEEVEEVVLWKY
jgi:hypothetical protein